MEDALHQLVSRLQQANVSEVARRAGLPRRTVQAVKEGVNPTLPNAWKIAEALGLELYIGPPRPAENLNEPPAQSESGEPGGGEMMLALARFGEADRPLGPSDPPPPAALPGAAPGLEPVADRRLAELLARFADAWEAGSEYERGALMQRLADVQGGARQARLAASSPGSAGASSSPAPSPPKSPKKPRR